MNLFGRSIALASILMAGLGTSRALAQTPVDYPKGPVKLVVGFAPGGGTDLMARILAKKLGERWGQSFIVENRAGAGGNIGAATVANARPDGHTLLFTSVVHSVNPSLFRSLPFDPVKDFVPVTTIGLSPICFAVHPSTPFKTLRELVAYAKTNPGKVSYSSAGGGTMMFLGMALFESMAGIRLLHVPYNSTGPSVQAAVAGHVQLVSSGCGAVEGFARNGQLRMLGIATAKPSPLTPGVPTIAEAGGVPGYEAASWQGVFAPAGTPQVVIDKLSAEIAEIQKLPDVQESMARQGIDPYVLPPAKFAELVRADIDKYQKIVKDAGLKPE
jgi:tripartite-type tricarboxylate transporter receptor subunit TctC